MEAPDDASSATAEICNPLNVQKLVKMRKAGAKSSTKKRSSFACRNCRLRKVRCDVTYSGGTCTNCRLDNIKCEPAEGKRSRRMKNAGRIAITHVDCSCDKDKRQLNCPRIWVDDTRDSANQMDTLDDHEARVKEEQDAIHDCLYTTGETTAPTQTQ